MTGAEQVPAKQDKASITKFLTTKTTDEMFNSPGQLAAAGGRRRSSRGGGSANGDRGVAGRRLTVGQVLGSARALGGRGGAGARARADRGLPRRVGSGRGGAERGDTRRPGASGGGRGRSGRAHREVLKLRDGEGEDDTAEPAESGQQMRR